MSELYVNSVMKSYGTDQILTDIFVTCKPGEIIGLLGRNGVGKSTLLKIIFGSLRSDRRFTRVNGIIVNNLFESRNLISYLPQYNFLPSCYESDSIQFIQVSWDSYVLNAWDDKIKNERTRKNLLKSLNAKKGSLHISIG